MYKKDNRIVATLDAGGTNFVFGAMKAGEFIIDPVSVPAQSHDLDLCLQNMVNGFRQVFDKLDEKPVAISFALSGYYGLYGSQKFIYSKTKTEFINIRAN